MIFPPETVSRAEALRILESALQGPLTWERLTDLARELGALLPRLAGGPALAPSGLRQGFLHRSPPPSDPVQAALPTRAGLRAMALLLDMCALGAPEALARCCDEALPQPDAAAILSRLAVFLDMANLGRDLTPAQLEAIDTSSLRAAGGLAIAPRLGVLGLLGLSKTAAYDARRRAFQHLAVPWMRAAAQAGHVDMMLAIESFAYEAYFKTVETPEHHTETLRAIEAAYAPLTAEPWAGSRPPETACPKLVFVIPNGTILAHTEVLLSFLAGLDRLETPILRPAVLIYGAMHGGDLGERLTRMDVPWEALAAPRAYAFEERYARVRERVAAMGADGVVIVSLPLHLAYFCRRPLAPVQIWWSMKFALPNFEALDGRVFYRSLFDRTLEIEGRLWRGGPLAITPPPRPDPAAVQAIRDRFPGKTILGTVAREEKIANPDYLEAIAGALQRHPDTCFLWTGRAQLREIQEVFDGAGVADRCHFIGWVDPAPYLLAFDLFIETYPLTGIMSAWAMAFGQPIVSVGSLGFIGTYLEPILDGSIQVDAEDLARIEAVFAPVRSRLPGLWAAHPDQIAGFADALLGDPDLRRDLGAAQRRYIETFMTDGASSAAAQARHFADVVREARARAG